MSLKLSTAENIVRKTWAENAGKKINKRYFNSVIKKFYSGVKNIDFDLYYQKLLPYIERALPISLLKEENFIEQNKEKLRKKMEKSQKNARDRGWSPSPYWEN
jgi:hypothetical protein